MIALDTNILVRYLLNDSPTECDVAENLLFSSAKCTAPVTVLLELVWVLESKHFNRPLIAGSIRLLRNLRDFSFDDNDAVNSSLQWYENGMGFADALHLAMSLHSATQLKTFDKAFVKAALKLGALPPVVLAI